MSILFSKKIKKVFLKKVLTNRQTHVIIISESKERGNQKMIIKQREIEILGRKTVCTLTLKDWFRFQWIQFKRWLHK